jgi:hypothetical protein
LEERRHLIRFLKNKRPYEFVRNLIVKVLTSSKETFLREGTLHVHWINFANIFGGGLGFRV